MPREVEAFVSLGLWGDLRGVGECQAAGFADENGLIGGVLFHEYNPEGGTIEVTAYFSRHDWMTRARLRELFAYPFETVGVRLVVARTPEKNSAARRFWRVLGATEVCIPELHRPGEALCVQTLSSDDWQKSKFMTAVGNPAEKT